MLLRGLLEMWNRFCVAAAAVAAGVVSFAAQADPVIDQSELLQAAGKAELLAAQNKYRAEVGDTPLRWSDDLAKSAQSWAQQMADMRQMRHSAPAGVGENLAMATVGNMTLTALGGLWGYEKKYFMDGTFPRVSTSGNWVTVAHYTQMVWKGTTDVGCGLAVGGGNEYLVCQYSPQGNVMTEAVY